MLQGLLPLRLNCPWRASAAAVVRSSVSVSAAIGAVQLAARALATSTSIAAVPSLATSSGLAGALYVALRTSPERSFSGVEGRHFDSFDTLTPCPAGRGVNNTVTCAERSQSKRSIF